MDGDRPDGEIPEGWDGGAAQRHRRHPRAGPGSEVVSEPRVQAEEPTLGRRLYEAWLLIAARFAEVQTPRARHLRLRLRPGPDGARRERAQEGPPAQAWTLRVRLRVGRRRHRDLARPGTEPRGSSDHGPAHPRYLRLLPRRRCRPAARRRARRGRTRGALHAQAPRSGRAQGGDGLLPPGGRDRRRRHRLPRLLRQAVHQVRAHPDHLPRDVPALAAVLHEGDPDLAEGEALDPPPDPDAARLRGRGPVRRTSPEPCGVGLPGITVRGGRDPHSRWGRRVGDDDFRRGAAATGSSSPTRSAFPTR